MGNNSQNIDGENIVVVGKITMPYGIKGWLKILSYTSPIDNILHYQPWHIRQKNRWETLVPTESRIHGKFVVAKLDSIDDRNAAELMRGIEIGVERRQLPPTSKDEYYWVDLQGLQVVTTTGEKLGSVDHLLETGANDVLVVAGERERLIPYVQNEFIKQVDLEKGIIVVDWDPEF